MSRRGDRGRRRDGADDDGYDGYIISTKGSSTDGRDGADDGCDGYMYMPRRRDRGRRTTDVGYVYVSTEGLRTDGRRRRRWLQRLHVSTGGSRMDGRAGPDNGYIFDYTCRRGDRGWTDEMVLKCNTCNHFKNNAAKQYMWALSQYHT